MDAIKRKGGIHGVMAQGKAWRLVESAGRGDLYSVFVCLRDGTNPNFPYVGVTALQMAVENGDVDVTAILLHWGAKVEQSTASRAGGAGYATGETAVQLNERLINNCKNPQELAKQKMIQTLMRDKDVLKKHVDSIQTKIEEKRIEYEKVKYSRRKIWFISIVLIVSTFISLHLALVFAPQQCAEKLPAKFLSDFFTYSPFFLAQNPFVPPRPLKPGDYQYYTVLQDRKTVVPKGVTAKRLHKGEL